MRFPRYSLCRDGDVKCRRLWQVTLIQIQFQRLVFRSVASFGDYAILYRRLVTRGGERMPVGFIRVNSLNSSPYFVFGVAVRVMVVSAISNATTVDVAVLVMVACAISNATTV